MTYRIYLTGRVQGVGLRPAVCRLAKELGITGTVQNLGGTVEIFASGEKARLQTFLDRLAGLPYPIEVTDEKHEEIEERTFRGFRAVKSGGEAKEPVFPADRAICGKCLAELRSKRYRRWHYPYISCCDCGPRYTITRKLPYDRENTTMKDMKLCPSCKREYRSLTSRRCHAETISCPHCGPQLLGRTRAGASAEPLEEAVQLLRDGKIIMAKAVGGFQLLCRGDDRAAVLRLRTLKHRERKPFALMVECPSDVARRCSFNSFDEMRIDSPERPILLLDETIDSDIIPEVADKVPRKAFMLPSSGFYALLARYVRVPLVVTSANRSGEPILFRDAEAEAFFEAHEEIAGFFTYEREILRPADDSVAETGRVLRRTRGYLPEPAAWTGRQGTVLATGADMEPSFCFAAGGWLYPAEIPCELTNEASEKFLKESEKDWEKMLGIRPQLIVSDMHPRYISSDWGREMAEARGISGLTVQHHHAHALSVIAEHQLEGPALAFVFDGTGYGTDGTIWGSEILLCEEDRFKRVGHLETVPMIGGDISMKQAWKTALCYEAAYGLPSGDERYETVRQALAQKVNVIGNSSMGRLFDAAAAILGLSDMNHFKGECPMAVEWAARSGLREGKPDRFPEWEPEERNGELIWSPRPLLELMIQNRADPAAAAAAFQEAVRQMIEKSALAIGVPQIIFSGGCFANRYLLEMSAAALKRQNFKVYYNEEVPCGDGGIALGQAYYGLLKLKAGKLRE